MSEIAIANIAEIEIGTDTAILRAALRAQGITGPEDFAALFGATLADLTPAAALTLLTDDAHARCVRFFATLAEHGIGEPLLPYQWHRYGPLLSSIGFPVAPEDRHVPDISLARRFLAWDGWQHRIRDGPPVAATTTPLVAPMTARLAKEF